MSQTPSCCDLHHEHEAHCYGKSSSCGCEECIRERDTAPCTCHPEAALMRQPPPLQELKELTDMHLLLMLGISILGNCEGDFTPEEYQLMVEVKRRIQLQQREAQQT